MPLTTQDLQESSSPASYQRGLDYYEQGRVGKLTYTGHLYRAHVRGSENYRVEFNPDDHDDANCTCPAFFDGDGWCKHLVAVGLSIIHSKNNSGEPAPASSPVSTSKQAKKSGSKLPTDIQHILQHLSEAEKNTLLEELLGQYPELHASLRIRYNENYDIPAIRKSLQKYVNALKRSSSDQTYLKNTLQFFGTLRGLGKDWPISEKASLARLQLVDFVYQQFDYIDDSSGKIQDICYQLLQQVVFYINQSGKDGLHFLQQAGFSELKADSEVRYILLDLLLESTNSDVEAWWRKLLEQSNVRDPKETGLSRQKFQFTIATTLSKSGNPLFLKHLDDFETVQHLSRLQAEYYYASRDWQHYLQHSAHDTSFLSFGRSLEAFNALQQWDKLASLLEDALLNPKLTHLYDQPRLLARYEQALKKLNLTPEQHSQKLGNTLKKLVGNMTDQGMKISLLMKMEDYQQVATLVLGWWKQRFASQNNSYYYSNTGGAEKAMYEALHELSRKNAEHAIPLNRELLVFEKQRLQSSKSNQYTNLQRIIENLSFLKQQDDIQAFKQFVNTHMGTRKKLVEWLANYT